MTVSPRELLAAAKGADDPDAGYVVLFEERVHNFDADGSNRTRYRRAYKILNASARSGATACASGGRRGSRASPACVRG